MSPAWTPARISVSVLVTKPTCTGRVTAWPPTTTCTGGFAVVPPTAALGTTIVLVRLCTAMWAWPVMPALAPAGSALKTSWTLYWTGVLFPALAVDVDVSDWAGRLFTAAVSVVPDKASNDSCAVCPAFTVDTSDCAMSAWATSAPGSATVAIAPPAAALLPTVAVRLSTTDLGGNQVKNDSAAVPVSGTLLASCHCSSAFSVTDPKIPG